MFIAHRKKLRFNKHRPFNKALAPGKQTNSMCFSDSRVGFKQALTGVPPIVTVESGNSKLPTTTNKYF
jgi:hypothetical protein